MEGNSGEADTHFLKLEALHLSHLPDNRVNVVENEIRNFVRIFEAVLGRAGLHIEDLADGNLCVHVHEPVIC